jgi:predicted RND superfamily exporter protein
MGDRLIAWLLVRRVWVLVVYGVLTLASLAVLPGLGFNFSFRQFFPESDEDVRYYNQFTKEFAPDDVYSLIAVTDPDLFSPSTLTHLDGFSRKLETIDGVENVLSLTTIKRPVWNEDELDFKTLFDSFPPNEAKIEAARKFVEENDRTRGNLISEDGRTTLLIVELSSSLNTGDNADNNRRPVLEQIWKAIDELRPHVQSVMDGGIPVSRSRYSEIIEDNTYLLIPLSLFVITLVLIYTLRHWAGVLLSLSVVTLALVFTMAIMVVTGYKITIMSTILPVVILIIGVADGVHFHSRYYEELNKGRDKITAISISLKHMAVACLLTSVTTAVGFSVLLLTSIGILRQYGFFVALGVMLAYVVSITLLPAALAVLPAPSTKVTTRYFERGTQNIMSWIIRQVNENQAIWVSLSVVLIIVSLLGASQVKKSMRLLEDLDENHPIIATESFIETTMGGVMPLEIILSGKSPDDMKNPDVLAQMDKIKAFMEGIPEIGKVITTADFIREMNRVMHDDDAAFETIPLDRRLIAQYYLLYDLDNESPIKDFVNSQKSSGRISARTHDVYSDRAEIIIADLRAYLDKTVMEPFSYHITGTWPIAHKVNSYMVDQIFYTFLLAFVVIFVLMYAQLRSIGIALLSMIPNVIPLLVILGVMGGWDIYLKPSTAVTFSIAFGIAVDDTIHFLTRFVSEFSKDKDYRAAVSRTLRGTGRAMVATTVILVSGFMVPMLFSDILSNRYFSILSNACIIAALYGDLIILPILILKVRPKVSTRGLQVTSVALQVP